MITVRRYLGLVVAATALAAGLSVVGIAQAAPACAAIDKGKVSHDCDGQFRTLYTERRVDPGGADLPIRVTVKNTGDCVVFVFVAGNPLFNVAPGAKVGMNTTIATGQTVSYFCQLSREDCEFKWWVR